MNESALAKFNYHEEFGSVKKIEKSVQTYTEQRYFLRMADNPEVHVVSNAKFGEFISGQFTAMEDAGENKKTLFLASHNHGMSLGLCIKEKNGQPCYVTKFYDPNQTTAHARSAAGHLNTIETKSIDDFLSSKSYARSYFPIGHGSTAVFVALPVGMSAEALSENTSGVERKLASRSAEPDVSTLHHLAQWGFGADLRNMVPEFNALPDKQKMHCLPPKCTAGRC